MKVQFYYTLKMKCVTFNRFLINFWPMAFSLLLRKGKNEKLHTQISDLAKILAPVGLCQHAPLMIIKLLTLLTPGWIYK